jgi:MYXO-CTERM domain-containing protein
MARRRAVAWLLGCIRGQRDHVEGQWGLLAVAVLGLMRRRSVSAWMMTPWLETCDADGDRPR